MSEHGWIAKECLLTYLQTFFFASLTFFVSYKCFQKNTDAHTHIFLFLTEIFSNPIHLRKTNKQNKQKKSNIRMSSCCLSCGNCCCCKNGSCCCCSNLLRRFRLNGIRPMKSILSSTVDIVSDWIFYYNMKYDPTLHNNENGLSIVYKYEFYVYIFCIVSSVNGVLLLISLYINYYHSPSLYQPKQEKQQQQEKGSGQTSNPSKPRSTAVCSSTTNDDGSSRTTNSNNNNGTKRPISTLQLGTPFGVQTQSSSRSNNNSSTTTTSFLYNKISPFGIYVKRVLGFEMFLEDIPQFILTIMITKEMGGTLSPYAVFSFTASGFNFLFNLLDMIEIEHYEQQQNNNSDEDDDDDDGTTKARQPLKSSVLTTNKVDTTYYNVYERMERS